MNTKYKSLLWVVIIPFIMVSFTACNSDDDDPIEIDEEQSELLLSETALRVIIGETTSIEIEDGNGEYSVFSLNEDIVTAELVDTRININALSSGKTAVIVSDKSNNYKSISLVSYYDKIVLEEQEIEIKTRLGHSKTKEIAVLGGNGGYKATSDNTEIADVKVDGNNIIIEGKTEGTVSIKIKDQLDIETTIVATITTTTVAYEGEELEAILNDPTNRFFFNGEFASDFYSSINTVEDGYNVYGYNYYSYIYQKVYFKGDKKVGVKDDALFSYADWYNTYYSKEPVEFEIVKNDGENIWAIFSFIKDGKLLYGHFVKPI